MTIDYSALTPEALSKMTDEEFNQIDPSKLPEATSGSFETTSDQLLAQGSDEVLEEDTEADPISQPSVEEEDIPHQQPIEPQVEWIARIFLVIIICPGHFNLNSVGLVAPIVIAI